MKTWIAISCFCNLGIWLVIAVFSVVLSWIIRTGGDAGARWYFLPFILTLSGLWLVVWIIGTASLVQLRTVESRWKKAGLILAIQSFPLFWGLTALWSVFCS